MAEWLHVSERTTDELIGYNVLLVKQQREPSSSTPYSKRVATLSKQGGWRKSGWQMVCRYLHGSGWFLKIAFIFQGHS